MSMTKEKIFSEYSSSGITLKYIKSSQTIVIHGWYDSLVGIEGGCMQLSEFLDYFGIDDKQIRKARANLTSHNNGLTAPGSSEPCTQTATIENNGMVAAS